MTADLNFEGTLGRDASGVCRICLKNKGTIAIFPEVAVENDFTLREKIMSFAYVEIVDDDGLPGRVCRKCHHGINNAFKLKAQCEYADFFLRQHLTINDAGDQEEDVPENTCDSSEVGNVPGNIAKELASDLLSLPDEASNEKNEDLTSPQDEENNRDYKNTIFTLDIDVSEDASGISIDSSGPQVVAEGIDSISEASVTNKSDVSVHKNAPSIILNMKKFDEERVKHSNKSEPVISKKEIRRMKRYRVIEGVTQVHKCTLCDKVYRFECSLRNHLHKEHEPSGEYSCTECGRTFPQDILLNMHVKIHNTEKPYCCSSCGKCFVHLQALQSHERGHRRSRKYLCIQCGNFFSSSSQHHCPASKTEREKSYKCKICGKMFVHQTTLNTHSKRHRLMERFRCKICSKQYFTNQELERHTNVHLGVRPFSCNFEECDHTFYTKGELSRHMRYHRGEKKFICDQCDKSFFESGHLVNHKRKHTGERPYICELCSKSFTDASKLKRHVTTHSGTPSARGLKKMSGIQSNKT